MENIDFFPEILFLPQIVYFYVMNAFCYIIILLKTHNSIFDVLNNLFVITLNSFMSSYTKVFNTYFYKFNNNLIK